ncbi:YveK family protein [Sporosarcina aquimarina]|uniref:Wzz/FepE/Etk N-terminal domain-containing protein n=1 Tax=Sporosarcina aquimarina TaxID=114975 RepID=A0ABU4FVX9_9BACL|nr:Wzz/FepE/Etk N-terminal domain-containing protein [Sporosarcina aquimarina]MDW0108871.1 Wzz/FepE/Etk N-terminal domain-containing protein [Sporosarcina aquimarina]
MEETISLPELFNILKKWFFMILMMMIFAVTIVGVVSYLVLTPVYQASTQILVSQDKVEQQPFNSQDIQTNLQLINTYNVIIKSPAILSIVFKKLDMDTTPAALTSKITVDSAQNSQVINISVTDTEPFKAVDIANTTVEVFKEEIQKLMKVDNVNILSPAEMAENPTPVKPNPKLNMAIAAVVGLMIGVGIAFLLEYLDTTIKGEQDVEELLELPILGLVSPISEKEMPTQASRQRRKKR